MTGVLVTQKYRGHRTDSCLHDPNYEVTDVTDVWMTLNYRVEVVASVPEVS